MKKIKITIISLVILILIIASLWICGIIPKQIGKNYAIKYTNENFPDMQLELINIEWNKYYGNYTVTFKDKDNMTYGCVIGPKYLPVNITQGLDAIEQVNEQLNNIQPSENIVSFNVNIMSIDGNRKYILNDAQELKDTLDSFEYKEDYLCHGIADYMLECNDGTIYYILSGCNGIQKDGKQANVTIEKMQEIVKYINDNIEEIK